MADKIIGLRPDGTLNPETIAAVKEVAGTGGGTGSVVVTDDGAGTYTVGGTTIKGLTTQGQLPGPAKKYVDDGLAGKANTTHTHTWADVTGKPTTFAPSAHTHAATDITTGTIAAARLPAATTSAQGALSADDKKKLDGLTADSGLTDTQAATVNTMADALAKSATEHATYATYQNLLNQKVVAGRVLTASSVEDAGKWQLNYQSTVETNPALADDGSSFVRLPANNNNAANSKPVHAYLLQPVSVTSGNTYAVRARVKATGPIGSDDYFRIMVGRLNANNTVTYVGSSSTALLTAKGVTATGYVDVVMTWTATLTDPSIVFGVQGGFLDNDLLVDQVSVLDTTGATPVTDQQVTEARNAWDTASAAARTAWENILPVGALTGGGGGVTTQTISRADYDSRRASGTLDPNVLYMVTA